MLNKITITDVILFLDLSQEGGDEMIREASDSRQLGHSKKTRVARKL